MEIHGRKTSEDYCWVLGLRNSHDKMFPAGIVAGASVFVCDNLSFSGEVKFARKHTRFINRDLPQLTERAIGLLLAKRHDQDRRIEAYKDHQVSDEAAHDLVIRSVDVGVCANSYIPRVHNEWRHPQHTAFESRNVWSLFNAFTETLKQANLAELPKRTQALHGLLDVAVGLN
jgi:molybdate-binding protein